MILYNVFHDFVQVYSPGSGSDNPRGQNFDVNRNLFLVTSVICYKFKEKSLLSLILYNSFHVLYIYIVQGQGLTTPWGQSVDANRNTLSLRSFVASFKNICLKSDFIHFCHDFIHVNCPSAGAAPGQGQIAPRGQSFDINRNDVPSFICRKFQTNVFEV